METYTLKVGSLVRQLPVVPVASGLSIASFVMLGDTELIETTARLLVNHPRFPRNETDILVCPEAKAIPLTHVMACLLGINYVVVRKAVKTYMRDPLVETVTSITTTGRQKLVLDGPDAVSLENRKVCIVDAVVSTGGSLLSLEKLLEKAGCRVIAKAAVLLEEAGYAEDGLIYIEKLPVFKTK